MNTDITTLQAILPILVPALIMIIKTMIPKLPKVWLPSLAPVLGAGIEFCATGVFGANTVVGAVLGSAGVGLREILDQVKKQMTGGLPLSAVLVPIFCLLLASGAGCASFVKTSYRASAITEASVEAGMTVWGDYVKSQRAQGFEHPEQEAAVKDAFLKYQAAMSAVCDAGEALEKSQDEAGFERAVATGTAALSGLLDLIRQFLPPVEQVKLLLAQ